MTAKKQFNFDFSIKAANETDANSIMQCLQTLSVKLSTQELERLAHIVAKEPLKLSIAKKYLWAK
jgi:hypothetical protein